MRKTEKRQILRNIGSSWVALGTNVALGIFLSPFILHRLGDAAFGIWILIFSLTGYYGVFDMGIRSAIVRFVAKFSAANDRESLAKVLNTSLLAYTSIGAVTFLLTLAGVLGIDRLFKIPPEFHSTARWLFLMVGTSVAVGFPLGVFTGALEGLQRFYLVNWMNIGFTLARAGLVVGVLDRGYGLLALAVITTALPLVGSLIRVGIALRILKVPISLRYVTRETARLIMGYSGLTFMIVISSQLRFQTDEIIIGTLLTPGDIAHFSIGARIVDYSTNVIACISQLFVPMASQSDAQGDGNRLRKMLIAGNRACAFTILPISATMIILGKSLIEVWVGAKYIPQSYPVMLVLIIPFTLMLAQAASGRMLMGTSQHRMLGIVTLVEGVINVLLSILLVRPYGIFGDALGTAIPLACTSIFFMPLHACRTFGIRLTTFLRHAYSVPLMVICPMVVTLVLEQRWFVPHHFPQLLLQLAIAWGVYGAGFLWMHSKDDVLRVDHLAFTAEEPVSQMLVEKQV